MFFWCFFKEELGTSWILMSSCQPQRLTNPRTNAREKNKVTVIRHENNIYGQKPLCGSTSPR